MTMRHAAGRATVMAILALAATTASAVDSIWNGAYAGFNAGQASSHTCSAWAANGSSTESATLAGFPPSGCASHGAFLGGAQIGDNFQSQRLALGVEADVDFWKGGSSSAQTTHFDPLAAPPGGPPAGSYSLSGRQTPDFSGMFTARIGYAGNQWLPYLKGGALLAGGSQTSTLSYIPEGAAKATASFNGGRSFASAGWVAGGGAEFGLYGAWSISAEYLHASLGKGSRSTAGCAGIAAHCAAFADASLQDTHGSFEANLIRIRINYWFNYW